MFLKNLFFVLNSAGMRSTNGLILGIALCSGYADRIYELMSVSRELRIAGGSESIQKKESGSYFVEAQYIEFEGVKVGAGTSTFNLYCFDSFSSDILYSTALVVPFNNQLVRILGLIICQAVLCGGRN